MSVAVVNTHISVLENDPSDREIGVDGRGQRSTRLAEDNLFLFRSMSQSALHSSKYSIAIVIFAVFCSMAETEQYLSFESRTASSTALCDTLPATL